MDIQTEPKATAKPLPAASIDSSVMTLIDLQLKAPDVSPDQKAVFFDEIVAYMKALRALAHKRYPSDSLYQSLCQLHTDAALNPEVEKEELLKASRTFFDQTPGSENQSLAREFLSLCRFSVDQHPKVCGDLFKTLRLVLPSLDSDGMDASDLFSTCRFLLTQGPELVEEGLKTIRHLGLEHEAPVDWKDRLQFLRHLIQFQLPEVFAIQCVRGLRNLPEMRTDFLSYGQFESKRVLLEELQKFVPGLEDRLIVLLGGWYGLFAQLLFQQKPEGKGRVISVDLDEKANVIAEKLNQNLVTDGWKFKTVTQNIHDVDYQESVFHLKRANGERVEIAQPVDIYINTSCEHIEDFEAWIDKIPYGCFVALQSNNATQFKEHINCVNSLDEFREQADLGVVLVERVLKFKDYDRYILIGRR